MGLFRRSDHRAWSAARYVVVDFETTDVNPRRARPLSVGWVGVDDGRVRIGQTGYEVIAHHGAVPVASMRVHQLLPADVRDGRAVDDVAQRLRQELRGCTVVAHGAWIETAMLDRLGIDRADAVVDTLAIVRRLDERAGRVYDDLTLSALTTRFALPSPRAHHAAADALTTALLFITLAGQIEHDRGRCTVDDLRRLGGR